MIAGNSHRVFSGYRPHSRAFTLIECVVATALVAGMTVTALTTIAFSVRAQGKAADRATGGMYADAMIAEIMSQAYVDPNAAVPVFGPEPGEGSSSRVNWNDVDDYSGWNESPLQNKDGTIIPNTTGWRRKVSVAWAVTATPAISSLTDSGCKRITVTVSHNGIAVVTRTVLRTNAP
ncbi:MAG TPA: type II secretion system protein [Tepidisphaeraceae bacterium]|jgi:type II secretory pathway pseudopilin PulG